MRIARILTRLNLGGPARQALASDPHLVAAGHEVRLYCGLTEQGEGDLYDTFRERGLDVQRIDGLGRGASPLRDRRALLALRAELRAFRPELVHTHASKAGTLGRLAARGLPGAARVHSFHGHVLEGYFGRATSLCLRAWERFLARRTDRVIAVSHATADDLLRWRIVREEQLSIVPPGVELDALLAVEGRHGELRRELGAAEGDCVVGMVGRLAAVKRPELGLEAFARLAPKHPGLRLVFVGDGALRLALEKRCAELPEGVRDRVHLSGARSDMPSVFSDLDVCLLTSRSEGLPVALIEASAAAKAIVAADVGGVAELVSAERTGLLGTSVDEWTAALARLALSPELRRALGRRARVRVAERHSARALARRLEGVYRQAVEERPVRLLMVSGDRQVAIGERGPFHAMLRSFSGHFERIDVIVPRPPRPVTVECVFGNVHFHPARCSRLGMLRHIRSAGRRIIAEHGPQLIVSHDYGWFYNGVGSARLSRLTGVPYLSELHHVPGHPVPANWRERLDQRVAKAYVRWARSRARAFRVVNAVEMPALLRSWGVPAEQIVVLPSLYIDHEVFRPAEEPLTPEQDVVFVGRLVANKGLDRLVLALAQLAAAGRPPRALFVGKGPLTGWLHARVRELGLEASTRFVEWLDSPEELAEVYRRSRVCVCASTCEGGPRVTVEAMACGTPVVSTPVGVMSELLDDGRAGRLVGFDTDSLAAALGEVLGDEEERRRLGQAAHELAWPYEYERALATYARGLHDLVSKGARPA